MKNREDFKSLIYEKCEKERAQIKKKRKRYAAVLTPVAVCFVLCCVLFTLPVWNQKNSDGVPENNEEHYVLSVVSVDVVTLPESQQYERHYTDEAKIQAIISYFNNLTLSDNIDAAADESAGMSYLVTVTYNDGSELTYVHFGNKYLRINNGAWKEMRYEEAVHLEELLNELQTDKRG